MKESFFKTIFQEEVYMMQSIPTVVVNSSWMELPIEQKELLSKILGALNLSLDAVHIVHQPVFDLSSWREQPSYLIAFVPSVPGIALYEVIRTPPTSMVISEPLSILIANEPSKRKLWVALQGLFSQ